MSGTNATSPVDELISASIIDPLYARANEWLVGVRMVMLALQDDPDDIDIERALIVLNTVRDALKCSDHLREQAFKVRGRMIALLSDNAEELTMQAIGSAAGVNDTMASRIARAYGAGRRPRPAQADAATPR